MNENEKLFDLLVKESVDRLDPPPDEELEMTAEELEIMEKQRKAAYKYVQKEIGRKKTFAAHKKNCAACGVSHRGACSCHECVRPADCAV